MARKPLMVLVMEMASRTSSCTSRPTASQGTKVIAMKKLMSRSVSSLVPLMLSAQAALAVIPEPDNLIYGTVSVDGTPVTAADTNVSILLEYEGQVIDRYTMGEDPSAQDRYVLEVPLDSVQERLEGSLRKGDVFSVRYLMGNSRSGTTDVGVSDRGTATELNLSLRGVDIVDGPDPDSVDSDGDGISDVAEINAGLNPFDASDALLDSDGDGVSNLDEYLAGRDINADDEPPLLIPPSDIEVPATGLLTKVALGEASAFDALDGKLNATNDAPSRFPPGAHFVTWNARDKAGNTAQETQLVIVKPIANFQTDRIVAEGSSATLTVELNGPAAIYPLVIPFTVSGTAVASGVDHTLASGDITIDSGLTGSVDFQVLDDGDNGEGVETIIATMGASNNVVAGGKTVYTASISDVNVPPSVSLSVNQGAGETRIVVTGDGPFTVSAIVDDPDPADSHTYDWSFSDPRLLDIDGDLSDDKFTIDPADLSEGFYSVGVNVRDSAFATNRVDVLIEVVKQPPLMTFVDTDGDGVTDEDEGFIDTNGDGVPDYLDVLEPRNVVAAMGALGDQYLIESEPGLQVAIGYTALTAKNAGAMVGINDVRRAYDLAPLKEGEESEAFPGGIFDFTISGLAQASDSARIVLPQLEPIPRDAVYRKYFEASMVWNDFIENANNALFSAPGANGYCPPPGDESYSPGLTRGDWCVMLYIEDGGPNDTDGLANRVIKDPGGVQSDYVDSASVDDGDGSTVGTSGGGGGGKFDLILLLILVGAGLIYGVRMSRPKHSDESNGR
eukprot:TRINITY_DN5632_c0_g4_i1.p1 TRINITY_DN5632_c0_g4~~TRINITY_DN5632_c0_g4_i1.p1  ORF type:complete len:787 (+),score=53.38 TRINITY_DN5632_c0_g4_i1:764-3124(+)